MAGFLGTKASFQSDLSLVLTCALGIAAAIGAVNGRRRRISNHCPLMATAALLNWLPVLVVMIPTWLGVAGQTMGLPSGLATIAPLGHGIVGSVTQLVMTYTVVRMYWLEDLPPNREIWLMRAAIALWILTVLGGIGVYVSLYTG
jgi:uncharacterized membrane protein YozB (DUF420 family)